MKKPKLSPSDIEIGKSNARALENAKHIKMPEHIRLMGEANQALMRLADLAKSDLEALEQLAGVLLNNVRRMNSEALKNPDHYGKLIRRCPTWPAAISVDRWVQDSQFFFVNSMGLGKETSLKYAGLPFPETKMKGVKKQWTRDTPENRAVLRIVSAFDNHKIQVPRLWKEARPMFEKLYGANFEDHDAFKSGCRERERQSSNAGYSDAKKWYRQKILSNMAQAYKTMVRFVK